MSELKSKFFYNQQEIKIICFDNSDKRYKLVVGQTYTYKRKLIQPGNWSDQYDIIEINQWVSSEYFITLEEWREQQLDKLI